MSVAELDWDVQIQVEILSAHTFSDLAPILDELSQRWAYVDACRLSFDPPAAGAEIALIDIAVSAGAGAAGSLTAKAIWELFFQRFTSAHGVHLRARVADYLEYAQPEEFAGRKPLSITCSDVRLYYPEGISRSDLDTSLTKARHLGDTLPESEFHSRASPDSINGYYWDNQAKLWIPGSELLRRTLEDDSQ